MRFLEFQFQKDDKNFQIRMWDSLLHIRIKEDVVGHVGGLY